MCLCVMYMYIMCIMCNKQLSMVVLLLLKGSAIEQKGSSQGTNNANVSIVFVFQLRMLG